MEKAEIEHRGAEDKFASTIFLLQKLFLFT